MSREEITELENLPVPGEYMLQHWYIWPAAALGVLVLGVGLLWLCKRPDGPTASLRSASSKVEYAHFPSKVEYGHFPAL